MNAPRPVPQAFSDQPRPQIALSAVKSQKVGAIGYDAATQTLAVSFPNGKAIYHYPNFSADQHADLMAAESIGKHFGEHIAGLPFEKFPPEPSAETAESAQAAA